MPSTSDVLSFDRSIRFDADVGNAELAAELRGQQRGRLAGDFLLRLRCAGAARILRGLQRATRQQQRDDLRLRHDGSEKKMSRGSRSVPRTLTPAFTSGNSLTARMSTAGSTSRPPLKISRPRSMSSLRASASVLPVLDLQFAGGARRLARQRAFGDAAFDVAGRP